MFMKSVDDEEDYKSIKLPVFSDGSEWEAVVFELKINLEKVWKHSKEMDIVDYLEGIQQFCNSDIIKKADKIIYHAIVTEPREKFLPENKSWQQSTTMQFLKLKEMKD